MKADFWSGAEADMARFRKKGLGQNSQRMQGNRIVMFCETKSPSNGSDLDADRKMRLSA